MKKALFSALNRIASFLVYLFAIPAPAIAASPTSFPVSPIPSGQFGGLADLTAANFGKIVGNVVTIAFIIAIVIALGFLVYGGIKWITSGGDKTAVEGARNTIVAAIVGLVIVFLAYFILNLILGFFGLSLGELVLPQITAK